MNYFEHNWQVVSRHLNEVTLKSAEDVGFVDYKLDTTSVYMLNKVGVPNVCNVKIDKVNLEHIFKIELPSADFISLEQFLQSRSAMDSSLLQVLIRIVAALIENVQYFLYPEHFLIDRRFIYIDPASSELALVYIPFQLDEQSGYLDQRLSMFAKQLYMNENDEVINIIRNRPFILEKVFHDLRLYEQTILNKTVFESNVAKERKEDFNVLEEKEDGKLEPEMEKDPQSVRLFDQMTLSLLYVVCVLAVWIWIASHSFQEKWVWIGIGSTLLIYFIFNEVYVRFHKSGVDDVPIDQVKGANLPRIWLTENSELSNIAGTEAPILSSTELTETTNKHYEQLKSQTVFLHQEGNECLPTVLLQNESSIHAYILFVDDSSSEEENTVRLETLNYIGREKEAVQICIEDPSVSRKHAKIILEQEQYFIIDLNSKNGTKLNDLALQSNEKYPLEHEDLIQISNRSIKFSKTVVNDKKFNGK